MRLYATIFENNHYSCINGKTRKIEIHIVKGSAHYKLREIKKSRCAI